MAQTDWIVLELIRPSRKEKPTNCGTEAADVTANFLAGKLKCESTEDVGTFATTMTSQHLSTQSVASSATV